MMKKLILLGALAATALLGGCWSDNGGEAAANPQPTANEVPDSALASAAAYTEYVKALSNTTGAEPVDLSKVMAAPASDSAPPEAI